VATGTALLQRERRLGRSASVAAERLIELPLVGDIQSFDP
jgi:hypothetical protein